MDTEFSQGKLSRAWNTRDIVVTAALAVVFGLLFIAWGWLYEAIEVFLGPIGKNFLIGFWFIGGVIVPYIIRKPGAALIGETLAAFVEMPLVPWGWTTIISGLTQGVASEFAFAVTGWRRYSLWVLLLAGALPAITSFIYEYVPYGYGELSVPVQAGSLIVRFIGGAVLAGLLSKSIVDALVPTGVLSGFPVGRGRKEEI